VTEGGHKLGVGCQGGKRKALRKDAREKTKGIVVVCDPLRPRNIRGLRCNLKGGSTEIQVKRKVPRENSVDPGVASARGVGGGERRRGGRKGRGRGEVVRGRRVMRGGGWRGIGEGVKGKGRGAGGREGERGGGSGEGGRGKGRVGGGGKKWGGGGGGGGGGGVGGKKR